VKAERVSALHGQLNQLAEHWIEQQAGSPAVEPEVLLPLERIDYQFWQALQRLEPFGIGNPQPLFWSSGCLVSSQKLLRGGHLQVQLRQGDTELRAIAWRWAGDANLPAVVDVAYRLRLDNWQGKQRLQLELQALRGSTLGADGNGVVVLQRRNRRYWCHRQGEMLVIRNSDGAEIRRPAPKASADISPDNSNSATSNSTTSKPAANGEVDDAMDHPYVRALLHEAAMALGLAA